MPLLEEFLNGPGHDDNYDVGREWRRIPYLFVNASKLRDVRMGVYGLLHYAAPLHAVTNLHLVAPLISIRTGPYPRNLSVS